MTEFRYTAATKRQAKEAAEMERRWAEVAYTQRFKVVEHDDYNDHSVSGRYVVKPA